MSQITLTLDVTPETIPVLCQVLPLLVAGANATVSKNDAPEQLSLFDKTTSEAAPAEKPVKTTKPKDKAAPVKEENAPAAEPEAADTGASAPTKTDVRALALKLSKAGKQDVLKELFAKYGADKLSGVAEEDYPALMEDLVAANG